MEITRDDLRNIAIIAHVDHGKTTLVDEMLKQSGIYRENQQIVERVMDSGDLERERGITILAKNTAVKYKDIKINIIDTPGHADFSGEVERVLNMVNGVLLLVDAFEGPMPQTRFVLSKALELKHPVIVVINKIDRADARPDEVINEVLDLLIDLGADASQLDSPFIYTSARNGTASLDPNGGSEDMQPLFDAIISYIPAPKGDPEAPLSVLVSTIDYSDYTGRIAIGRIHGGTIHAGDHVVVAKFGEGQASSPVRLNGLNMFDGLRRVPAETARVGDIVAMHGISDITIGDTVCSPEDARALPFVNIGEPTVTMLFSVNDSPFAGREGKYVTSRHLRARLHKELQTDVSLRVEDTNSPDTFMVYGRGELHLSILIETMRRQGYEFQVSAPEVLYKAIDGVKCEPMEHMVADVPQEYVGVVIEKIGVRRGVLNSISGESRVKLDFTVPSRGLLGYRSEFLTDTRGFGIMSSVFKGYFPAKGDIPKRTFGSLIAFETGTASQYGLFSAQDRGTLFINAGLPVYAGMIVGANSHPGDIDVNICRRKHLTGVRNSAAAEDPLKLAGIKVLTLEESLEYIEGDELVEITPDSIRLRKKILKREMRQRAVNMNKRNAQTAQ